jgi:hypothetical protein
LRASVRRRRRALQLGRASNRQETSIVASCQTAKNDDGRPRVGVLVGFENKARTRCRLGCPLASTTPRVCYRLDSLTIVRIPALIASGSPCRAATTAASSGSVLQFSVGR